jgi:hypothetical protein
MFRYLKAAFWVSPEVPALGKVPANLLVLAGLALFGLVNPGFWLLGLALEIAFLFSLAGNKRFQQYVDAQRAKAARQAQREGKPSPELTAERLVQSLPGPLVKRFHTLRKRCLELRQLAQQLKDPDRLDAPPPLEDLQLAGLDRLLWIYLRLLFTQYSLERFLQETNEAQIRHDIDHLQARLRDVAASASDAKQQKKRKVLEDNLETSRSRLTNYQKARENCELVQLEIDRLENKIRSLSELAINRHEPDFISGHVDQVVAGMVHTERTMTELQFATGLTVDEDTVPSLLRREIVQSRR